MSDPARSTFVQTEAETAAIQEKRAMTTLGQYDMKALIIEYAKAKSDFDAHRLDGADSLVKERFNRLVAIEQLLIQLSGVTP